MTLDEARQAVEAGIEVAVRLATASPVPDHRRHGHRQHDGVRGAGLRVHRRRPGGGDRPRHRRRRPDPGAQGRRRGAGRRRGCRSGRPTPEAALAALAEVGGLEHAALAGFVLGAAAARVPVLLDGAIAGSAALVAAALCPTAARVRRSPGTRPSSPGTRSPCESLGLRPLLGLDLRLGEGTGALLALPLVASAARALRDVATFDSAGVTEK